MNFVLFLFLLVPPTFGQSPVETIKASVIVLSDDEIDARLVAGLKSELRKLRHIAIVERGGDWIAAVTVAPISGVSCAGYAATLIVGSGRDGKQDRVSVHTAPDLETLARHLVEKLKREYLDRRAARD